MKIKISFLGVICSVDVKIYDSNNNIIYSGQVSCGEGFVYLKPNAVYRLVALKGCEVIDVNFYVNSQIYCFAFPSLYVLNNVTLFLTDYFYPNLPIERGEIIL